MEILDPEKGGSYSIVSSGDVENVDPIEYFIETATQTCYHGMCGLVKLKFPNVPIGTLEPTIMIKAKSVVIPYISKIVSFPPPINLISVLNSTSKKEQIALLKGVSLSAEKLISMVCFAYTNLGFRYSEYVGEHDQKGLNVIDLPTLAEKMEDGTIKVIGETMLSEGQLRNAIEHRRIVSSKFLDKDDVWYCFFLTAKGIRGEEAGSGPHLHYISSSWGLTREYVLEQLKGRKYGLPSLPHIEYTD